MEQEYKTHSCCFYYGIFLQLSILLLLLACFYLRLLTEIYYIQVCLGKTQPVCVCVCKVWHYLQSQAPVGRMMIKVAIVPAWLLTMLSNYLFLAKKFAPGATERRGTLRSMPELLYSHEKSEGSTAESISREVGAAATLRLRVCLCPCLLAEGLKQECQCTW